MGHIAGRLTQDNVETAYDNFRDRSKSGPKGKISPDRPKIGTRLVGNSSKMGPSLVKLLDLMIWM